MYTSNQGRLLLTWVNFNTSMDNFTGAAVEVWEWIRYFDPQFTGRVIDYPSCDLS